MRLFVGLGNPGAKYAGNRHNIGFMAVDRIAADHGFAPRRARFQGEISEGRFGSDRVALLKPMTFMNLSGQSVGEAMRFYKLEPVDVTVFHDELDLAPGKCRHKIGGGHAGHNGLRSIHQHIGEAYGRIRLGIGHPGHKDRVAAYVLHDFAKADADWLDDVLRGISDGAAFLAAGDAARFMNAVALRTNPPRSGSGAGESAGNGAGNGAGGRVGNRKDSGQRPAPPAMPASGGQDRPADRPAPAPDRRPETETETDPVPGPLARLLGRFSKD